MQPKKIVKREVRFSWHIAKNDNIDRPDIHYVREDLTFDDGTTSPKITLLKDFVRKVYVTKESFRDHKDKKEFESLDKLNVQETTQSDINRVSANMLGMPYLASQPDKLKSSPYLYGYDITSTAYIKLQSLKRNEFVQSTCTVAVFDIETNPATNEILIATIAFEGKTYSAVLSKFFKGIADVDSRVKAAIEKFLPNYKDLPFTIKQHDNEVDLLKDIFRVANEWKPVFLAAWNIDFDFPKVLERLDKYGVNPVDVICDQSIPRQFRVCRYKQGLKKKVTASGVVKPINPSLQWHTLICTSTFYVIDAMCVYRQLRMAQAEKSSYSLDNILKEELKSQKLKFEAAAGYKGLLEHIFLQENYPIEYLVYNLYDCLGVLELDKKNKDISNALPSFAGISDFQKFNSQVRKVSDAVFLFGLDKGLIIGTVGNIRKKEGEENLEDSYEDNEEEDPLDPSKFKTLGLKGWIQLLPQNLLIHNGLKCLEDYPDVVTNVRGITSDLDASSAYPSSTLVGNVSKKTTRNELISIEGVPEPVFRDHNLSLCLGGANMLDYFHVMFGLPKLSDIDAIVDTYL